MSNAKTGTSRALSKAVAFLKERLKDGPVTVAKCLSERLAAYAGRQFGSFSGHGLISAFTPRSHIG